MRNRRLRRCGLATAFALLLVLVPAAAAPAADVGYLDGSFTGNSAPTGEKPQSKLWFADGTWWAVMYNPAPASRFEIFRRNAATETWTPTGAAVDGRKNIWSDAKWDGTYLYVVSHGLSETSVTAGIRISRFSYDSATKSWSLSSGFPLTNVGTTAPNTAPTGTEAAVIDKDSSGRIWLAWTRDTKVWVTHSTTSQTTFVAPYVVPVPNANNLTTDDMATLVAYDGRIGVLWSNQAQWCMCFAFHSDGAADSAWTSRPLAGPYAPRADKSNEIADDHMNIKAANDGSGRLFAVTKTSLNQPSSPLLALSVFNGSSWSSVVLGTVAENSTRPQFAVDTQHGKGYAIYANPCCSGGVVYMKQTSLASPGFPAGLGTPFIQRADTPTINNVSTTKQTVDATSDLVVIAGDDGTKRYVHNTLDLGAGAPTLDSTIDSGPEGTVSSTSATFSFSSATANSTFECKLDAGAFAACGSPKSYSALAEGSHTFQVRAIDSAGSVESTPAARTWNVEDPANSVSIAAEADTYATSTPNANYGTSALLYTDKAAAGVAGDSDKQSFLRFTISDPRGIVSAKLRLWVTGATAVRPSLHATSNSWGETTLNWTNKPAPSGAALDPGTGAVGTGYVEYDVTSAVTTRGTYSFLTTTGSTDAMTVASKEATAPEQRPTLLVRVNPVPDTTITSGPPATTNATSAHVEFTSNDAGATFECQLDSGAYAGCASPSDLTGLAAGSHTFSVRARNAVATDASPATKTWTVDTTAPGAPALSLAPSSDTGSSSSDRITADVTPTFSGTAEAGATVRLSASGTQLGEALANSAGDWTVTIGDLAEGSYPVTATATDPAGNASVASSALALVIDTTAPSAAAITNPAGDLLTKSRDLTVTGTAGSDLRVDVVDGTTTLASPTSGAAGDWSAALTNLADGSHSIAAIARDVAGNGTPSATRLVTVDTVAPDTTITTKPADPSGAGPASFAFTATQTGSTFECSIDRQAYAACTSPKTYTVAQGSHSFGVRATDPAGNLDPTPATYSWSTSGLVLPAPVITAPADGSFSTSATVTVRGTAQSNRTIEVREGTTTKASTTSSSTGAWSVNVSALASGAHTLRAYATALPQSSDGSNPVTVTVDTTAPQTTIGSAPANPSSAVTASIGFSSSETDGTFACRLDGSSWATCTSPYSAAGLAQGSHTFEVRATDAAGNVDATPAMHTWVVDTIAPDTTIDSGPTGTVDSASATFTFSSAEAGSTFACSVDGGAYSACASPRDLTGLAPGSHSFDVRATDGAGNTDATAASRTWQVQLAAFSDGFESGTFSAWNPGLASGLGGDGAAAIVTDMVRTGTYAARLSETANAGSFARLRFGLPTPLTDVVTVDESIRVEVQGASGGNVPLLRLFNASGVRMLSLYRQNGTSGAVSVSHGTPTVTTAAIGRNLPLNTWVSVRVRVVAGPAGAGTVTITWDGVQAYSSSTASLGSPAATVQIGNETKAQTFQLVADDVVVAQR